jgi:ribulose-phosphate 3-epimerase
MMDKRKGMIAASLICADPLNLEADIDELIKSNVEMIHFDMMDGHFVSRYGLYPEILTSLRKKCSIPVDVHMMVENPEDYIQLFKDAGADYYNMHVEGLDQLHRCIKKVQNAGMKPGVALNPATPLSSLDWIINDIQMVVLMTINPGIVGHKLIPSMMDKIAHLRAYSAEKGNPGLLIEIDGGVTPDSAPAMLRAGADVLVCGNGTIFRPHEDTIFNKVASLRSILL